MNTAVETVEEEIQRKGLNAPRIVPEDLDRAIARKMFLQPTETLTICVLVLRNGFTVTGESSCASPENFDAELGQRIAFEHAREKLWPLLGYALRQRLFEGGPL